MKILVPVKRVVDHNIKPRIAADGVSIETQGVKMSMNPFDEIALEEAIRLREKNIAHEVIAVSIGPQAAQDVLRTSMAMGADKAILLKTDLALEPLNIAKLLEKIITREAPHIVLMGKQAIDDDMNATGQILAAKLGWAQATFASKVTVENNHADVTREIDGGTETLKIALPAIITADLRLNEPRYASLPNIMKARKKPLETLEADSFGIDLTARLEITHICEPPERKAGIIVDNIDTLIEKLKTEAKVL